MISAVNQNTTTNGPSFKAIIPIKSVKIAKELNYKDVFQTQFEEVFDEKQTKSLVNHIRNVLLRKTTKPTQMKRRLPSGGYKVYKHPAEETNPLKQGLYTRIRARFSQGPIPKDCENVGFKYFQDRNTGDAYILTGKEAKIKQEAGKRHHIVKTNIKETATNLGKKAGKRKEDLAKFVEQYLSDSPAMHTANKHYAQTVENLLSRVEPNPIGINLFGVKKPGSTAIEPVGIGFEKLNK